MNTNPTPEVIGWRPKGEKEATLLKLVNTEMYGAITHDGDTKLFRPLSNSGDAFLELLATPVYREVEKKEWRAEGLRLTDGKWILICHSDGDPDNNQMPTAKLQELADLLNASSPELTDDEIIAKTTEIWNEPDVATGQQVNIRLVRWALSRSKGVKKLSDVQLESFADQVSKHQPDCESKLIEMGKRVRDFYENP